MGLWSAFLTNCCIYDCTMEVKEARVLSNLVKNRSREGRLTLFVNPVFRLGLANSRISDNTAPSSYSDTFSLMRSIRVLAAKLHSRF